MPTLAMPLFVTPLDVILRMQLDKELSGIEDTVASGIVGAQLHVQRMIDSKLVRQSQDCMYQLFSDAFSGIQPGGAFRLEVPSGFIRRDTPVLITASDDISMTGATPFGTFDAVDMTAVKIEYDRGYILIGSGDNTNCFVRVRCDTGFEDGTSPYPTTGISAYDPDVEFAVGDQVVFGGVVYTCKVAAGVGVDPTNISRWVKTYVPIEQLPEDLYEAIMAMVPVIFDSSQTTNRAKEALEQYKKANDHSNLLLSNYIRTKGFTFRPIWSS